MARLFISTLKGVAFIWFRSLPLGSINSWIDLKTQFLSRFYEDESKVTMDKLFSTVPKRERIDLWLHWEIQESISDVSSRDTIAHVIADV